MQPKTRLLISRLCPTTQTLIPSLVQSQWLPANDEELTPEQILGVALVDLLIVNGLSTLAAMVTIREMGLLVADVALDARDAMATQSGARTLPNSLLVLVNRRFVTFPGLNGFLDLWTGGKMQELPEPAVLTSSVHLGNLYQQTVRALS
jgi:hypothetical protein